MGTNVQANINDKHANKTHRQAQLKYVTPQKQIGLSISELCRGFLLVYILQ